MFETWGLGGEVLQMFKRAAGITGGIHYHSSFGGMAVLIWWRGSFNLAGSLAF